MAPLLNYGPRLVRYARRPLSEDTAKINGLVGSVRSGKTWVNHGKIINGCKYDVGGWRLITGQSKQSIYNNVLNDLFSLIGPRHYNYNSQTGIARIFGVPWLVMGANDLGSEKILRGLTVGIAVCDELVLMPEMFFDMLVTRMSPPGARLYFTTNPDNPRHWLKKKIDDKNFRKMLWLLNVTMDDNPNLTEEYKDLIKATMKGLFYQRFILGRWVAAEGAIYRDCWDDVMIYDELPLGLRSTHADRYVSTDCGVVHAQVYGEFFDDGKNLWLDKEYFWDSNKQQKQKTDAEYADDLGKFMGQNNWCQVIVPPEAASFRAECVNRGMWVTDADNKVKGAEGGIKSVATAMAKRILRINRRCVNVLDGIPLYIWDPKASERGEEEPLKQDDDAMDMLRYGIHGKIAPWRLMA